MPRAKKDRDIKRPPVKPASRSRTKGPHVDIARRNSLVEEYYEFAELVTARLIRSMRLPVNSKDDFISAGLLGLIEAAGRFDASKGYDFEAYAYQRIRGAIIDYVRTSCDLTGHAYRRLKTLEAAQELREAELEGRRAPSEHHQRCSKHALSLLEKIAVAFKVNGERDEDEEHKEELDLLHPEAVLEEKQKSRKIRTIVATLPEKERTIIEQYYFRDLKFVEVAEQFSGVSKSWVSRLHDRALEILREKLFKEEVEMAA